MDTSTWFHIFGLLAWFLLSLFRVNISQSVLLKRPLAPAAGKSGAVFPAFPLDTATGPSVGYKEKNNTGKINYILGDSVGQGTNLRLFLNTLSDICAGCFFVTVFSQSMSVSALHRKRLAI